MDEKEIREDIVKSAWPMVAQKATYYLRQELLLHQMSLKENDTQNCITFDEFIENFIRDKNKANSMPEGPERNESFKKLMQYKQYIETPQGDRILLSEQNLDELMSLVTESIETLGGVGGNTGSASPIFFMRGRLMDLEDKISKEPDSPEKLEKLEKINRYMTYLYLDTRIGLEPNAKFLSYEQAGIFGGNAFQISQYDPKIIFFGIKMDGTVTRDLEVSLIEEAIADRENSQEKLENLDMQEALKTGDYATYKKSFDTLSPEEKIDAILGIQAKYNKEKSNSTQLAQREANLRKEEQISSMISDVEKEIDQQEHNIED